MSLFFQYCKEILRDPAYAYSIETWEFEGFVADVFPHYGFRADVTQRTRDVSKDIVAQFEVGGVFYTTYFECKQYAQNRPVGVNVVRELYAVMNRERVDKGVIVTTSYFTRDTIAEASTLNGRIRLIDFNELQKLMR